MDAIAKTREKLQRYPDVRYEADGSSICVLPATESGFAVSLNRHSKGYTVYFEFWHEEFGRDEEESALNCFAFGLSRGCRLKVCSRGNCDYRWTVESKKGNEWIEWSETGLFWFPYWKRKEIRYLQNDLISNAPEGVC